MDDEAAVQLMLDRIGKLALTVERVALAIEHHQISIQSIWEALDQIANNGSYTNELLEAADKREEEQFQWRLEERRRRQKQQLLLDLQKNPKEAS